jgi:hypothetical protein
MKQVFVKNFNSPTLNTWLSLVVRIGGLAILLPIVLRHFDINQVLVWQMLSSLLATVLWVDFGFSPTFSRFIAVARGGGSLRDLQQDRDHHNLNHRIDLREIIVAQRKIYTWLSLIGLCVFTIVGIAALRVPVGKMIDPMEGWWAAALTAATALLTLLNGRNSAVLIGFDEITKLRRIESFTGLFQIGCAVFLILFGGHLIAVAVNSLVWTTLSFALVQSAAQRKIETLEFTAGSQNRGLLALAWKAAWRSGIGTLASAGIIQGSGLLYPQIAPAAEAAAFLLVLRLISVASQISQAPFYTKLPAMAKAKAEGDHAGLIAMAKSGMSYSLWIMALAIAGLVIVAPLLLMMLGGSVTSIDPQLSVLLGLAFFAERYGSMHMQIYTISNHVIWHKLNGLAGFIMIVVGALLYPVIQARALPVAMLVGYGCFLAYYVSDKSLRFLNVDRNSFERATSFWPACVVLTSMLFYFLLNIHAA